MEEVKVLITTSGLGSRLGNLTDFTNKSLVRVGDKPAISHIIDSYPTDVGFVITLGHYGNHVKDYLDLAYANRRIEFVTVDKYQGSGSSLAYSISCAKDKLNCPFIFHACDTIINSDIPIHASQNWCLGAKKEFNSQYRTLNVNSENDVIKINEKGAIGFDYSYAGVCKILDYTLFWDSIEKFDFNNTSLTDCHVINIMMDFTYFKFIKAEKWFDIGNTTDLKKTRGYFKSKYKVLDKENESIFFINNSVIKFFSNETVLENRYKRSKILKGIVPTVLEKKKNFYKYDFVAGDNFADTVNTKSFNSLLLWSKENLWKRKNCDSKKFKEMCRKFYITKTKNRISKYLMQNCIKEDKTAIINGEKVDDVLSLLNRAENVLLRNLLPVSFHGDYILDNIIKCKEGFSLIDWRQDFGGDIETGDLYYDIAKLNHNLVFNHSIVNGNNYKIEIKKDRSVIKCDILRSDILSKCQKSLENFIIDENLDLEKVRILTAIIWINMAPLHMYPLNDFLFYFGKYNLHYYLKKQALK